MRYLRTGSSCLVLVGPVIRSTDGYRPLEGMSSALIDINFWLHTTDWTITTQDYDANNSFTTFGNGYIALALNSSNVKQPGSLRVEINASASGIPTFDDFQVLSAHTYDALFAASGTERLQTDMWEITGTGVSTASPQLGVNVIQIASAAVSTVTAQIAVNTVLISSVAATAKVIGTGTVYDNMDHGTLMAYMQSYILGDFGVTGPSTNVVAYKNYSGSTVMSHTFTTKTREWSSA